MAHNNRLTRFTDAAEEPTRALTPIKGYETKDLVSLEEATAEVDPPISDVDSMVWLAKRDSRNPLDELTSDESASIRLYTSEWPETEQSVYTILNKKLRSSRRHELRPWFSYLKLFLTALYKLPSLKTTIWRGVSGNIDELYKEDFIWWGFSSCTATMKVAEKFVGRTGVRTLFMIDCINGKSIESHSQYKDEKEILLMPGTFLRVIDKCNPADDLHIIRLQEETPPYQLIAPPFTSASASALSVNTSSFQKLTISTSGASTTSVETKKNNVFIETSNIQKSKT